MKFFSIPLLVLALLVSLPVQALTNEPITNNDLLALVAMPLAVAAVSDLTGVPADDLASLVASMNQADVPPVQFVEVIRYVPVALVAESTDQPFVNYVQTRVDSGVRAEELVNVIAERLRTYDVEPSFDDTVITQSVWNNDTYVPPVVRTRTSTRTTTVRTASSHPHGGPPGQLKKELGVQTGAEVVHAAKPPKVVHEREVRIARPREIEHHEHKAHVPPGQMKEKHGGGHGGGHGGHGNGGGHGHGKGKG